MRGDRDGFQPCAMDSDSSAMQMPRWERNLVIFALIIHVFDIFLDLLVLLFFFVEDHMGFAVGSCCVILWAWLVSSLYISFGGSQGQHHSDGIDSPRGISMCARLKDFCCNFAQVQIFAEAYRCIFLHGDTDYFHTLRLMEAILESAPNSVVQLYALVSWAGVGGVPNTVIDALLRTSVVVSFVSVGLGLAMWEQKVQFRTSGMYIASVAMMRFLEIASRSLTLALFSGVTIAFNGFWWALIIDYGLMVLLIVKHQSVQFTYGLFLAVPLVFVSLEPLVWRREDHAVPKDNYYTMRIIEFVLMWMYIIYEQGSYPHSSSMEWANCQVLALSCTLLLYLTLPCIYRVARQHELSRDVTDWAEEGGEASPFTGHDDLYSDSGSPSDSGSDGARGGLLDDNQSAE